MADKNKNTPNARNFFIFGIMLICLQIINSIATGVCVIHDTNYINVTSIFLCIALAILCVIGFGLVLSYLKKMFWSGVGFSLLITAICLVYYPLANAFWTKTRIQQNPVVNDFSNREFKILGSNYETVTGQNYSNTITTCFKCALAIIAAFSTILGRVGPLECLIVTLIGGFGYQFNRQLITVHIVDSFGTLSIFTFGGFMGLSLAFIMRMREINKQGLSTQQHPGNSLGPFGAVRATLGSMIIFVFFPVLALDLDAQHGINTFNTYIGPLCIVIAMASAMAAAFITSILINGKLLIRDVVHAPIAGAIMCGSGSFFAVNLVQPLIAGVLAGVVQTLIQNFFQKPNSRQYPILSTISWSLFGVQGFLGGLLASAAINVAGSRNTLNLSFRAVTIDRNPVYMFLMTLVSAAIGLVLGILIGIILRIVSDDRPQYKLFNDFQSWKGDNGIDFKDKEQKELKQQSPQEVEEEQKNEEDAFEQGAQGYSFYVEVNPAKSDIKDNKAYL